MIQTRLGITEYLNTKPLFYGFNSGIIEKNFLATYGSPRYLNHLLAQGDLDISLISSAAYALHPGKYFLLPDLSISSYGPVASVILFSRVPFEELNDKTVLLTDSSFTSIELTKILLRKKFHVSPLYRIEKIHVGVQYFEPLLPEKEYSGMLLIGDDALHMKQRHMFPYMLDLGESWYDLTGLPFVFAVFAVRKDFCVDHYDVCQKVYTDMLESKKYGLAHLAEISEKAHKHTGLTAEQCREYFKHLSYGLDGLYLKGLQLFFKYLYEIGSITEPSEINFMTV
ncbi:MAG: menaquinone biosynthesis protein [Pseudomonadota bacterium]